MTKTKYLYGAAVQGIQSFIFQTNKLREIIGASELVEQICTSTFREMVSNFCDEQLIIGAAGNIKYIFNSEAECASVVKYFPKVVMEMAPGITISQAVVKIDKELSIEDINQLEDQLKVQRNKKITPLDFGYIITERSRRTGLPAFKFDKDEAIDLSTKAKIDASFGHLSLIEKIKLDDDISFPYDFEEMTSTTDKNWLAVIHADGNGLGKVLQQFGKHLIGKDETEIIQAYKQFSQKLDESTVNAADIAVRNSLYVNKSQRQRGNKDFLPFRPIVLGGDDLTIIIKSEYALNFTEEFLSAFELETERNMKALFKKYDVGITKLTACAGIAYIKSSYPFHYGYNLAENLCGHAKMINRDNTGNKGMPSCLMFHKIQSSFVASYKDIVAKELTCYDNFSFCYGPYYLKQTDGPTIEQLRKNARILEEEGAPSAQLRRWLTDRYTNKHQAALLMERIIQILEMDTSRTKFIDQYKLKNALVQHEKEMKSPFYDIVSIASLQKK